MQALAIEVNAQPHAVKKLKLLFSANRIATKDTGAGLFETGSPNPTQLQLIQ